MASNKSIRRGNGVLLALLISVTFTSCDWLPPEMEEAWVRLRKGVLLALSPERTRVAVPMPTPSVTPDAQELISLRATHAKVNAEILQEIYSGAFGKPPENRTEFGSLVDSLNQGASFEGIHNGLIHGTEYRKLEHDSRGASLDALGYFAIELTTIEQEFTSPIEFNAEFEVSQTYPEWADDSKPSMVSTEKANRENTERYNRQFVGASVYVLKRVLADEALRLVSLKKSRQERLALWYSKWAVQQTKTGVNFGVAQRNIAEEGFHFDWALKADEDRLKWEVLNRIHRTMNRYLPVESQAK